MLSADEIVYEASEVFRHRQATSLCLEQPGLGRIAIDVEELNGASLSYIRIETESAPLTIPVQKPDPVTVMHFQLKGAATFNLMNPVHFPENHHSLCYLPVTRTNYVLEENTSVHSLNVHIRPDVVASQLLEEGISDDDWHRLLETEEQTFSTAKEARFISPYMRATLQQILRCPFKGRLGQTYKDSLLRALLIDQFITFRHSRQRLGLPDTKLTRRDVDTLQELKKFLDTNYLDDLSLDRIARRFGLNTFKLKYGFKKLFGTSVMRYLDDQRMDYARQLLLDGNHEPWDVAERLGYNHYSNFSAAFRRRFGCPPTRLAKSSYCLQ